MEPLPRIGRASALARRDVLLAGIVVPVAAVVLLALGTGLTAAARQRGHSTADLTVALGATLGGVLVTAWWAGGLAMLAGATLARRRGWLRVERITTRLTPVLVARAVGALVGLQLVAGSPAHAGETVDPFWAGTDNATAQTTESAPTTGSPRPGAPAEGAVPRAGELARPGATASPGASSGTAAPGAHGCPDRAPVPAEEAPGPAAATAGTRVADGMLTVLSGDTLWDLTSQLLGADAGAERIAAATATWAEHNDLPGGPDLIHPGDRLRVPPQLLDPHRSHSPGAPS